MAVKKTVKNGKKSNGTVNAPEVARLIVEKLSDGIISAAAVYREYVQDGGDPKELRKYASIGDRLRRTLDAVACNRIDVRALVLAPALRAALLRLPVKKQADVLDNGVRVAIAGAPSVIVRVSELTADQIGQVFYRGGIRTIAQQTVWRREREALNEARRQPLPRFEIKAGLLWVHRSTTFRLDEIREIQAEMEAAARG